MVNLQWETSLDGCTWLFRDSGALTCPNKVLVRQGPTKLYKAQIWKAQMAWKDVGEYETLEEAKAVGALMYRIEGEMT